MALFGGSIFVDSIAQWRLKSGEDDLPNGLLAHIIQDEFSEVASDRWIPKGAFVTAPLIWPDKGCVTFDGRIGVLVHTGGMTSPAAADNLVGAFASEIVAPIVKSIASLGYEVVLLGNSSVLGRLSVDSRVKVLGNVSPASAIRAIGKANVLITTPGKGAIYEAMSTRTPIILLPPINST